MEATDRAWKAFLETKPDFEKLKREARGKGLVEVYETDDEEDGPGRDRRPLRHLQAASRFEAGALRVQFNRLAFACNAGDDRQV